MKRFRIIYVLFITPILLTSCLGVFDKDLSDGTYSVNVKSPNDSLITNSYTVTFWWDDIVEAREYHLQAVHPNFSAVELFIFDTVISENSFTYTFTEKGEYQFRIAARNSSSETPYTVRTFTIDNTIDLAEHTLIIVSPANNYATNQYELEFKWVNIAVADEYLFSVQKDNADGEYIVEPSLLYNNSFLLNNSVADFTQGTYYWTVKAKNDLPSETAQISRTFIVDRTAPGIPVNLFPINDTIITERTVTFRWERYDDGAGSPVYDTLFLLKKNESNNYVIYKKEKNGSNISQSTLTALPSGNFKWYVKTYDNAKNSSDKSGEEFFTIE